MKVSNRTTPTHFAGLRFSGLEETLQQHPNKPILHDFTHFQDDLGPKLAAELGMPNLVERVTTLVRGGEKILDDTWDECCRFIRGNSLKNDAANAQFLASLNAPEGTRAGRTKTELLLNGYNALYNDFQAATQDKTGPMTSFTDVNGNIWAKEPSQFTLDDPLAGIRLTTANGNNHFRITRSGYVEREAPSSPRQLWGHRQQIFSIDSGKNQRGVTLLVGQNIDPKQKAEGLQFAVNAYPVGKNNRPVPGFPATRYEKGLSPKKFLFTAGYG